MKKQKVLLIILMALLNIAMITAAPLKKSVAIVVDKTTYQNCRVSIDNYSASIDNDGSKGIIIVDEWGVPDSIKTRLLSLYKSQNLEGAVFIGNVPIAMIRDAQHLTTAFKMDQRRDWKESSVPSDRFYDDFDLKFDFIKRDSTNKLYHYYSLNSTGPQTIRCDIYSARIKPPVVPGKNSFQLITEYLNKVVAEKSKIHNMSQISYYAGHGYNSDCMVARIDEKLTLSEQFPFLKNREQSINYIDYTYDDVVKYRLLAELQRPDLDLAILHHHGSEDLQLMNGSPLTSDTQRWIEMSKKFFRGKIRSAKDTTSAKKYYVENYKVPESWVANAFKPEQMKIDSLEDAAIDIHISDLYNYKSGSKIILLDACFNGSFHLNDYISAHYIFNPGSTIIVKANSVNTLQDTWTNQLLGLLDLGVSVGNWSKGQMTLESHLIGDPTYKFASTFKSKIDLNDAIVCKKSDIKLWKSLLKNSNPEVKSLAMKMLHSQNAITTNELLDIQKNETRAIVRLQAFTLIKASADENLGKSIKMALYDNYELTRRLGALTSGLNYSPEFIDDVFSIRYSPGTSKRVEFQLKSTSECYNKDEALAAFKRATESKDGVWYSRSIKNLKNLNYVLERVDEDMKTLLDEKATAKEKKFIITALRNSCSIANLDTFFKFLKESKDQSLRVLLVEAFGWYKYSFKKQDIIKMCQDILAKEQNNEVRSELIRTINRLKY